MIRVEITQTKGSTPREVGAAMIVSADTCEGTIGGGALEWQAMAIARKMIADGKASQSVTLPLGPNLGQCCGGVVQLEFRANAPTPQRTAQPVWIWGAGHVGRALVHTLAPLPRFDLTWIDTAASRFPDKIVTAVTPVVAKDPALIARRASADATHVIVTYSHDLDLKLCDALLRQDALHIGLIGSATKWARFQSRLQALGHSSSDIARITCPIGDPALGKHPQAIAVGVAQRLILSGESGDTSMTAFAEVKA